jgi:hypothetical protein
MARWTGRSPPSSAGSHRARRSNLTDGTAALKKDRIVADAVEV